MQTKTFTLLVTVTDEGVAAVFNPVILAAAVKGALEGGCDFALDSTQVEALKADPLICAKTGYHRLAPAVSADVDAFEGDVLRAGSDPTRLKACAMHRDLRTRL